MFGNMVRKHKNEQRCYVASSSNAIMSSFKQYSIYTNHVRIFNLYFEYMTRNSITRCGSRCLCYIKKVKTKWQWKIMLRRTSWMRKIFIPHEIITNEILLKFKHFFHKCNVFTKFVYLSPHYHKLKLEPWNNFLLFRKILIWHFGPNLIGLIFLPWFVFIEV